MKTWKQCTLIGILAILVFIFVLGCGGSNSLKGTWKHGDATIEFSGKNFTITQFPILTRRPSNDGWVNEGWHGHLPFTGTPDRNTLVLFKEENNRGEQSFYYRDDINGTYAISGNKITMTFSKDGSVKTFDFSRAEDEISIQYTRLIK